MRGFWWSQRDQDAHRRHGWLSRFAPLSVVVAVPLSLGVLVAPATAALDESSAAIADNRALEAVVSEPGASDDVATGKAVPGTGPGETSRRSSAESDALAHAAASGEEVEVVAARGEGHELWALPGGTLQRREFVVPRWVRIADGWQRVDATLEFAEDGSVAPVSSTVDLSFSGGGDDTPLVSLARHGRQMEWSWPGDLPEPSLQGATAIYPDVLDGVDLRMTATEDGFASYLVVKNALAAASPELQQIQFELSADGLDVRATESGGLAAEDQGSGAVVFEAPPATMWEAGSAGPQSGAVHSKVDDKTRVSDLSTSPEAAVTGEGAIAPVDVQVSVEQDQLTLTPDLDMLLDPATNFPLIIDPRVATPSRTSWTATNKSYPTSSYWKFLGEPNAGLGTCAGWSGCTGGSTYRLFYQFDVSKFKKKSIISATFHVDNTHSAQCTKRDVHLFHTKNIDSSTTWNTQAASGFFKKRVATQSFAYGGNQDACRSAGTAEFPVTDLIGEGSAAGWNTVTFGMKADSETDEYHWKRFSKNAYLEVQYNSTPHAVDLDALSLKFGGSCERVTSANPLRLRTKENIMSVSSNAANDPDGESVRAVFRVSNGETFKAYYSGSSDLKV